MHSRMVRSLACAAFFAGSVTSAAATLTLRVTGIEAQTGALMIAVFDSAEAFDNDGEAVRGIKVDVDADTLVVTVEDLEPGTYGVKMYHDANGNGEMDTNMMGMPSEQYGFSGNKGRFGPPPFAKAAVEVVDGGDNETTIKLR
ncbi:MAG: DUF2141 domain-containing protein [Pseudomonadota bacterium]